MYLSVLARSSKTCLPRTAARAATSAKYKWPRSAIDSHYVARYSTQPPSSQQHDGVDQLKVFRDNATKWWNGKEFSILRSMNQIRVPFIVNGLTKPIEQCKLIDVGCGGGILSEPLARLGANVLGIDPVFESINEAQLHAQTEPELKNNLTYRNCNIEDLASQEEHIEAYDGIVASEVLEHINDVEGFLRQCTKILKPNGSLFITTINQTPLSWLGVIFFGETVLKQLPKGTHTYDMFVSVKALRIMLERMGYQIGLVNGFMYEPISGNFHWTPTTLTHYAIHAIKTMPLAKNINYDQKRHMGMKGGNKKKPKIQVDDDELSLVIDIDAYRAKVDNIMKSFKSHLETELNTKASASTYEKLLVKPENFDEPLELRDIAQMSIKGSNLIVINLTTMPEAIKPTMKALAACGVSNAQVEVNNIYISLPKITREFREKIAAQAKKSTQKYKDEVKAVVGGYSNEAKSPGGKKNVSQDLVRNVVEHLRSDMDKKFKEMDELLASRTKTLMN